MTTDSQRLVSSIIPKVIGIFRRHGQILVSFGTDTVKNERYARPLGGTIEFGERAEQALHREIEEEIGAAINNTRLLGVLENTFTLEGEPRHEILFVFEAEFVDRRCYESAKLPLRETGWEGNAEWADVTILRTGRTPLYPTGVLELIERP